MSQATLTERPYVNSNLFANHYLDDRLPEQEEWECEEEAENVFDDLLSLYEKERSLVTSYNEDALIDNWIDEVLDILGFGAQDEYTLPEGNGFVDELLFESESARREATELFLQTEDRSDVFERGIALLEAKQWEAEFNTRFGEQRPYRNASHQIKHYLENTPDDIEWGILTNGRKWRLYGTNDYETQTFFEIDLPELLEAKDLKAFKYFYVLFRPEAFRKYGGTSFLHEVWSESETASQELGENLQDNVFTALRVLGRGFVETNDDLEIDHGDEEGLAELKDQSLVLLYRLMFILYAESRGLIHPESQAKQKEYEQNFSLDQLRLDIHESIGEVDEGFEKEYSEYSTTMWNRLEDLFRLIDEGEEDLGIPPYNGGLFNEGEHEFLVEYELSNRYLAEVIYRLSTTKNDQDRYLLADYADLDTRHLGSVYEGLLEHQFRIAPEDYAAVVEEGGQVWKPETEVSVANVIERVSKGRLYVVNDKGERKATGAYYTPDYVVMYIVEETIGPLIKEIREDLIDQGFEPGTQEYIGPFLRRVTDLRILDPAMGSGHFLTRATGYLAEKVMAEVRQAESEFGVAFNEQHIRREIAKECIYGVDVNGMAVELAKLSMWLETLAADRPLAFLDHHFKQGNSLVGSEIEAIDELESDTNSDDNQSSLAEYGATREGTIERLMEIYSDFLAIENETVEDVYEMKRKYAEIEQDELRRRLISMADVYTTERFDIDIPGGAYERMANALEDDEEWLEVEETDWFQSAVGFSESESIFHWGLEFPTAFYGKEGKRLENDGFDAVIGNPPYSKEMTNRQKTYFNNTYEFQEYQLDRYLLFLEQFANITREGGTGGLIVPNTWLTNLKFDLIREYYFQKTTIHSMVDYKDQVFPEVTVEPITLIFSKIHSDENSIAIKKASKSGVQSTSYIKQNSLINKAGTINISTNIETLSIGKKFADSPELTEICNINLGTKPFQEGKGDPPQTKETVESKPFVSNTQEDEEFRPLLRGSLIESHLIKWQENYWIKFGDWLAEPRRSARYDLGQKIVMRQTGDSLVSAVDENQFVVRNNMYTIIPVKEKYDVYFINGLLNSAFLNWYYQELINPEKGETLAEVRKGYLVKLPMPQKNGQYIGNVEGSIEKEESINPDEIAKDKISGKGELRALCSNLSRKLNEFKRKKFKINDQLLEYLGNYTEEQNLPDTGFFQPTESDILNATADDFENLRIGTIHTERDGTTVTIYATARFKPEDGDEPKTDRWGYIETEELPAMRLTDLSTTEMDLLEAFLPVVGEKAGGFAGFRKNATKTISLIDRLKSITLPDSDEVEEDLNRYNNAKRRAEDLDEKIAKTDHLIDEIVYDLYDLTNEEIEIVKEAVNDK